MSQPTTSPRSPFVLAAQEAFDDGDRALLLARAAAGASQAPRRPCATGQVEAFHAHEGTTPAGSPHADARRAYDTAHHHYLNAASLHYTGEPRPRDEAPDATIDRLPSTARQPLAAAHDDYRRAAGPSARSARDDALTLERIDQLLTRLRDELEARAPQTFGGRGLPPQEMAPAR